MSIPQNITKFINNPNTLLSTLGNLKYHTIRAINGKRSLNGKSFLNKPKNKMNSSQKALAYIHTYTPNKRSDFIELRKHINNAMNKKLKKGNGNGNQRNYNGSGGYVPRF